jgi:hypothetical protein
MGRPQVLHGLLGKFCLLPLKGLVFMLKMGSKVWGYVNAARGMFSTCDLQILNLC